MPYNTIHLSLNIPQVYLLMVSNLLCRPCSDIPYSAKFNLETLEDLFELGESGGKARKKKKKRQMSGDAAQVLLAMSRALLHEVCVKHVHFTVAGYIM